MEQNRWFEVENVNEIPSPALLVYHHRVLENIKRMIEIAGDTNRLRPHIKTHKMSEILRLEDEMGISKCKCSTIAEAELAAMSGVKDILLAMQPVGPQTGRLFNLIKAYPFSIFSAIVDSASVINQISAKSIRNDAEITLYLDINNGMNRTGIEPGDDAAELYKLINDSPYLKAGGLHVYDGHIGDFFPSERKQTCDQDFLPVHFLKQKLEKDGFEVASVIAGGSPTFPFHAANSEVTECSPGTTVLWDYGYTQKFPDLNFLIAALVLTRIVSKPGKNLICLDLGHKAIASEMPHPRVKIIGIDDYIVKSHSEEHLVLETDEADKFEVGQYFYGIPYHICPTVTRYERAYVIKDGKAGDEWMIEARDRKLKY